MGVSTGISWLRKVVCFGGFAALSLGILSAAGPSLNEAESRYQRTDYQGSLALLNGQTSDAEANFLIGRNYFMLGDYKRAADSLQKAIGSQPSNAEYADWLGKIYGRRAEVANPLLAPGWAIKARQAFERSVELDPKNSEALDDLFDYYIEAPGFLGGGYEKAAGIARKIAAVDPPEGHSAEARLAQKRKEYGSAESDLRQAIEADPRSPGHRIALAQLLVRQGRTRESDDILLTAMKEQPGTVRLWFARADMLIQQKRNPEEAKALLEKYTHATLTVDDPPREQALRLLKQVGGA